MGMYGISCPQCRTPHYWFSGNSDQRCHECKMELVGRDNNNKTRRDKMELDLKKIAEEVLREVELDARGVVAGVKLLYDRILAEHKRIMDQMNAGKEVSNGQGEQRSQPVGSQEAQAETNKEEVPQQ